MALEYKMRKTQYGDIDGCDCCQSEVPTALFNKPPFMVLPERRGRTVSEPALREDQFLYCEVCSATFISSVHNYPEQHREDGQILICMAQCTNMILEQLGKFKQ